MIKQVLATKNVDILLDKLIQIWRLEDKFLEENPDYESEVLILLGEEKEGTHRLEYICKKK